MKIYASIAYDGSRFQGMVSQPGASTVQSELENILATVLGQSTKIRYNSRTDKGVHAYDQRVEFEVQTPIPAEKLACVLNPKLEGVQLNWTHEVPQSFDIRKWPHEKEYWYQILWESPQPFLSPYHWCLNQSSGSRDSFSDILKLFVGNHDFELLSRKDPRRPGIDTQRRIQKLWLESQGGAWTIKCVGSGFLWYMIRNMVAYALACQFKKISQEDLKSLLRGSKAYGGAKPSITPAPAGGLYLRKNQPLPEVGEETIKNPGDRSQDSE